MATKKTTGKQLADMMYGGDQMRATPQSSVTGPIANAVRKAQQFASQYQLDPRIPLLGGTGVDELLSLPDAASLLEDVSYNGMGALVRGGNAATGGLGTFRPDPRIMSAADLAGTVTGVGQLGSMAAKAAPGALKIGVRNMSTPRTLSSQAGVIKMKGGNFLGGRLMGNMDKSVSRLRPYSKAGEDGTFLQKSLDAAKQRLDMLEADPYKNDAMVAGQRQTIEDINKKIALNNWVTNNLGKYTKNQMATPEDPIRLLLDKRTKEIEAKHAKDLQRAERVLKRAMDEPDPRRQANMIRESERLKMEANVERQFAMDSIIPSRMQDYSPDADYALRQRRQEAGFPAEGMGESEAAKRYETLTDDAISSMRAGDVQASMVNQPAFYAKREELDKHTIGLKERFKQHLEDSGLSPEEVATLDRKTPLTQKAYMIGDERYQQLMDEFKGFTGSYTTKDIEIGRENPFIAKLDPETTLYSGNTADMGFDHVIDILKQDVMEGRIRPEQLSKVSVEDAVRRTMEFDQEAARKMAETQIKATEGFPVYKEYPEGYRWIELKKPEDLPEGYSLDDMGNVIDEKGHLTNHPGEKRLEEALKYEGDTMGHCVGGYCPDVLEGKSRIFSLRDAKGEPHVTIEVNPSSQRVAPRHEEILAEMKASGLDTGQLDESAYDAAYGQALQRVKQNRPPAIAQIKGKQNAAPKEAYLPYVQDFVKSGKYSEVGDLQNTGLVKYQGKIMTQGEADDLLYKELNADSPGLTDELGLTTPPADGMARGGLVHFSDNPDVMQLELAGGGAVRMQAGGLPKRLIESGAKAIKALKTANKAAAAPEKELTLPSNLPRATPRTKEDLRPYAQQMAEATRGDFYRPDPAKSVNPAGKSFEQFKMEQGLVHDIRPTAKFKTLPRSNIEDQKGMVKMGISGDTTVAEKVLHEAGPYGLDLPSPQHGGALYGLGGEGAWASNNPIAKNVQERINEISQAYGDAPVLGQYMQMGKLGSDFALHFADANLRAIDLTKMSKGQIESVDELIRKGSKKSGARPSFPGIEDKESAYLHFAVDPELRKHFNAIMQKPTYTDPLGLPDGRIIHHAITEPELQNLPVTTTGFSQMELQPGFDPSSLELSAHPTYSHVIPHKPNTNLTRTSVHIPAPVEFPDVTEYLLKTGPRKYDASDMTRMYQTSTPRQIVDQQHIDEIKMFEELMKEYGGKKAGGEVKAQKNNEQRVQNPVHFTENPDAMLLELMQRN